MDALSLFEIIFIELGGDFSCFLLVSTTPSAGSPARITTSNNAASNKTNNG